MNSPIATKHFFKIMELLNDACQASVIIVNKDDDEDIFNYYENLRNSILETFSSYIVSSKEREGKNSIVKFKNGILGYVNKLVNVISPDNQVIIILYIR